jgi:hypothetical protein
VSHDNGAIYVATGEKFVALAAKSAISLRQFCPNLAIHIFTDCDVQSYDCFDGVTLITDPHSRSKVDYLFQTPYQRTLFLDADTRVFEDISDIFMLLDRYDIAMAQEPSRGAARMEDYPGSISNGFAPLNSGVILFNKSDSVTKFFKSWRDAYHEGKYVGDQSTLRGLVWQSDLRFLTLPPEYNVRYKFYIPTLNRNKITPKILHLTEFKDELDIMPDGHPDSFRKKIKRKIKSLFKTNQ